MDPSPAQIALLPASQALDPSRSVPAVLERAGAKALFAADEFFAARISNPHTRRAYARVVRRFLTWCEDKGLELARVSPGLAGRFIDELPGDTSTKNQALAGSAAFLRHPGHPPRRPLESLPVGPRPQARHLRRQDSRPLHPPGPGPARLDRHFPRRGPPRSGPCLGPWPTPGPASAPSPGCGEGISRTRGPSGF